MKVKCPKCRLKFEVPAASGITEVQCNCPRCGTPFTYKVTNEDNGDNWSENLTKPEDNIDGGNNNADAKSGASSSQQKSVADNKPRKNDANFAMHRDDPQIDPREALIEHEMHKHHHDKQRAYSMILSIMAIIILVGLFAKGVDMFIGHFTDSDKAVSERLAVDSSLIAQNAKNDSIAKAAKKEKKKDKSGRKKKNEALPQWLQGKWHLHTSAGYVVMTIKENKITVTDGHHTNKGTVHCKKNLLICKYHDGRTFEYNLDKKNHHIVVQEGMELTKTD